MPIEQITQRRGASDYPEALSTYKGQPPLWRVVLYPHRSLPAGGFVFFIAATSILLMLPLLPLIGTSAMWGLLPFLVATIAALWFFIMRSYRDGHLIEELSLWPDRITLVRLNPRGKERRQDWQANPYWVAVTRRNTPVENYLTLTGGSREVELGAFLSAEERLELKDAVETNLRALHQTRD